MDNFYRRLTIRMFIPITIGAIIGTLLGAAGAGTFLNVWWTVAYFAIIIVAFVGCYLRARYIDKVKAAERAAAEETERIRDQMEWRRADGPSVRGPRSRF